MADNCSDIGYITRHEINNSNQLPPFWTTRDSNSGHGRADPQHRTC